MKKLGILLLAISFTFFSSNSYAKSDDDITGNIVIGTAGTAGTFYAVGATVADVLNKNTKINAVSQGTNGATENIRLLNSGEVQIGFGNWDAMSFGYNATDGFTEPQDIAMLMTLYRSVGQMVVKENSGINDFSDLKGKKINLGPRGSAIPNMIKAILIEYGIDPDKDVRAYYLAFNEGGKKLQDGDLDATFYLAGAPTSGLIELSTTTKIKLLPLDKDVRATILEKFPYYTEAVVPAGVYNGVDEDVDSIQLWTSMAANPSKMSDEMAYKIVETLIENIDRLRGSHQVGEDITLEHAALKSPIPFHPGAKRFYEERGVLKD